jgi:hypothetical protein
LLLFIWHICFRFSGLYFSNRLSTEKEICLRIVRAVGISSIALLIFAQFAGWKTVDIFTVVCFGHQQRADYRYTAPWRLLFIASFSSARHQHQIAAHYRRRRRAAKI